jgi:BirA family biotin operon repressor/biotin-[acetyl-CoA-carboxylase] ligase
MATIVLDQGSFDFPLADLPLRAAVAACLAVEDCGVTAVVKLPNDLMVKGKKLAGILCETCNPYALVGIGVNCLQTAFPGELAEIACSILQVTGREVNPFQLLPRVLIRLKETIADRFWREKLLLRLPKREKGLASPFDGPLS